MNKCKSCIYAQEIHEYDTEVYCEKRGITNICLYCVDYLSKRQVKKMQRAKKKLEKLKAKVIIKNK